MNKMIIFVTLLLMLSLSNAISAETPIFEPTQKPDAVYRLFRTTNMWTFLKLDTRDGRMWQVQFDVEGNNQGIFLLNDKPLIDDKNQIPGRFTLYHTSNMYNFILLDQINGRTWQVQWSMDPKTRILIPIKYKDE